MHFRIPTLFCVLSKNACMSHAGFKFIGLCVVCAGLPALSRSCHRCCWRLPRISNGKFAQVLEVAVFERIKMWWLSSIWSLSCLLFLFEITRKRYFLFERSVKDTLILDTFFQLSIFEPLTENEYLLPSIHAIFVYRSSIHTFVMSNLFLNLIRIAFLGFVAVVASASISGGNDGVPQYKETTVFEGSHGKRLFVFSSFFVSMRVGVFA